MNGTIDSSKNELELRLIIEGDSTRNSSGTEFWKLNAYQVLDFNKLFSPIYLPYTKLAILEDHPLL